MGEIIELARTQQSTNQRLRQADDLIDSSRTRYRELYEDSSKAVSLKICLARNNARTKNLLANLAALTREAEEILRTVYDPPTETMPQ